MKKLISLAVALTMIVSLSASVFATDGTILDDEGQIGYKGIEVDDGGKNTKVPVFGYIGPATDITDSNPGPGDEPGDPGEDPGVNPPKYSLVQVVVPVKLMWAAFHDDNNEVKSPEYKIQNKSFEKIDVTLQSFTTKAGDAENVNSDLKLNIEAAAEGDSFKEDEIVGRTNVSLPSLNKTNQGDDTWKFKITGTYTGSYNTIKLPEYTMTLKFDIPDVITP